MESSDSRRSVSERGRWSRGWLTAVLAIAEGLGATRAEAAPSKDALRCEGQARDAQLAREKRSYIAARPLLLACASAECPALIQKDCSRWLDEVDLATPTLVLELRGTAASDARIAMDGRALIRAFDGTSIPVDPGPHHFVVQVTGRANLERDIVVFEGEKLRKLTFEVTLPPAPPLLPPARIEQRLPSREPERIGPLPPPARAEATLRVPFWIATSTAVAGLAAGGMLLYVTNVQRGYLDDQCQSLGGCREDERDALRARLLVGDVLLGVGLVASVAATIFYFVGQRTAPAR